MSTGWFIIQHLTIDYWDIRPVSGYDTLSRNLNACKRTTKEGILVKEDIVIRRECDYSEEEEKVCISTREGLKRAR